MNNFPPPLPAAAMPQAPRNVPGVPQQANIGLGITSLPTGHSQTGAASNQFKAEKKKEQWPKILTDQPKYGNGKPPIFEAYVVRRAPTESGQRPTWRLAQFSKMRLSSNDILLYEKRGKDVMQEYDHLKTDSMRNAVDQVVEHCNNEEKDPIYQWDLATLDVTKRAIPGSRNFFGYTNASETTQIRVIVRRDLKPGAILPLAKDNAAGSATAKNPQNQQNPQNPQNPQKPKNNANPQQPYGQVMGYPPQPNGPMGPPSQGGMIMGPPQGPMGPQFPQGIQMMDPRLPQGVQMMGQAPPPGNQQRPMPPNMQIPPPPMHNMGPPMPHPPPHGQGGPPPIEIVNNNNGFPPRIKAKKTKKQNHMPPNDPLAYIQSAPSPNFDSNYDSDHGRKPNGKRKNHHSPRMSGALHGKSSREEGRRHQHRRRHASRHRHTGDSDSSSSSSESYASDSSEHSTPYTSQSSERDSSTRLHRKSSRKHRRSQSKPRRHSTHVPPLRHHTSDFYVSPRLARDRLYEREIRTTYLPYDEDPYRPPEDRLVDRLVDRVSYRRPPLEEDLLALSLRRPRVPRALAERVPPRAPRPPYVDELARRRLTEHEDAGVAHIGETRAYLQGREDAMWDEAVRSPVPSRLAGSDWARERREGSEIEAAERRRSEQWGHLAGSYDDEWARESWYP